MDRILTQNIWHQVGSRLDQKQKKIAAVAYVTDNTHLKLKRGDTLVCDASDGVVKAGETSAKLLQRLARTGVEIYSCAGLHAKSLVCGDYAVIGSANLSTSSARTLIEAALITRRFQTRSQLRAFIEKIIAISIPVDESFLKRIIRLPITRRFRPAMSRRSELTAPTNKSWLVSTSPLSPRISEKELEFEEKGEAVAKHTISKART